MGLDGMRVGGGRCPPLFVGGLLIACFLLVCNWWSISTENLELLRQLDELKEQLKISTEERDQCVTLRENLEERYKVSQDDVGNLHVRLQQQNELKKHNSKISESLTMCKSELDSLNKLDATKSATLETLRLEKDTMSTQLDAKKDENEKLKADLETAQNDLEKLKHSINVQKGGPLDDPPPELNRGSINEAQLGPDDESAVKISVSGQRGMRYYGIPILPRDAPGETRQAPRLSVTMLKAPTSINDLPHIAANDGDAKENADDTNAESNNNTSGGGGEEANRFIMPEETPEPRNEAAQQP